MAKEIVSFAAGDGKVFPTAAEADAHDAEVEMAKDVETYIVEANLVKAQAGFLRKHLPAYFAFVASRQPQAAEA